MTSCSQKRTTWNVFQDILFEKVDMEGEKIDVELHSVRNMSSRKQLKFPNGTSRLRMQTRFEYIIRCGWNDMKSVMWRGFERAFDLPASFMLWRTAEER